MHISQGDAVLNTHTLGSHPIVKHFPERLNLQEIVRSCVGSRRERRIDNGEALAALVHNILDSPAPLCRIAENWEVRKISKRLQATAANL